MTAPTPAPTGPARLSPGEQGLWMLHQLVPDQGVTNVAVYVVESTGPVRWWPLREAFQFLLDRHSALRTSYLERDGEPFKVIAAPGDVDVDVDVMHATAADRERDLTEYAARPFDVRTAPLARLGVQTVDGAETRICLVAAHLAVDAASVRLLLTELRTAYAAISATGEPPDLPSPRTVPPADCRPVSLRYWRERLTGYHADAMQLAPATGSPLTFAAAQIVRRLPDTVVDTVSSLCRRCGGTEASVLLAAYLLALRSQGAADDAVVGVMVSNRPSGTAAVGYYVSTVPVRAGIVPDAGFADLVRVTGAALLDGVEHADVSFEQLALEVARSGEDPMWWRSGVVRQTFNYRPPVPASAAAHAAAGRDVHTGLSRFQVELTFENAFGGLFAQLAYSTEVHDETFATALLERIEAVLLQAGPDVARPVGDLDLRTAAEREVAARVNRTAVRWPGPQSVPELILAAVNAGPDAPAVRSDGRTMSYAELGEAAAGVAAALHRVGVRPGEVIALGGVRGPALAAAVLGTWLAGAAYLPLDPGHPAARLVGQLDDADCRIILDGHLLPADCHTGRTLLAVGDTAGSGRLPTDFAPPAQDAIAYVIYTSGSTGEPKGVRLTHRNLANVVRHFAGLLDADASTVMLWLTTFAFDISALELCLPLTCGGTVVVAPDEIRASPEHLLDLVERSGVSLIQATPTTWRMLLPEAGDRLAGRVALCGGEPMSPALARQLGAATGRAFNVYGPTETTIWSTVLPLGAEPPERITVGYPIANTGVHVLDARQRPVPPMVVGELCLSGAGVASGYHERPELTADRFRTSRSIGRYYRTGDVARQLPDGRIELLGRRDRQVKLRGHRIELGEVEHALAENDQVAAVSVVVGGDPSGADGHLVAFVVPAAAAGRTDVAESVWESARNRLPAYCVPGRVVVVSELPQTPNGKVDVVALTHATEQSRAEPVRPAGTAAPPARWRRRWSGRGGRC